MGAFIEYSHIKDDRIHCCLRTYDFVIIFDHFLAIGG